MAKEIVYVPIDFVGGDEKAEAFNKKYAPMLVQTQAQIKSGKLPMRLALKTTAMMKSLSGWGMTPEGAAQFDKGIAQLREAGIDYVVDTWASGPTKSMYGVLFNFGDLSKGASSICTGDLDQFPPNENLQNFILLDEQAKRTDSALGVGSRSVPVVLSYNSELGFYRRIFEGVMNLTARMKFEGGKARINAEDQGIVDEAYKAHGDMITGIYLFNPDAPEAMQFANHLMATARKHGFNMFEDEYFMVAKARRVGIASRTFKSVANLFSPSDPSKERDAILKRQIQAPLEQLAKTEIRELILKTMEKEARGKGVLGKFYTEDQIQETFSHMYTALDVRR